MNDKKVILDIGIEETKIMEVYITGKRFNVSKTAKITDMMPFISGRQLKNIKDFIGLIIATFRKNGIKSKNVVITSTLMSIATGISKQAVEPIGVLKSTMESVFDTERIITRTYDWQYYGVVKDIEEKSICVTSNVAYAVITALATEFKMYGYKLISVEDNTCNTFNLCKIFDSNYDCDCRYFINLGRTSKIYCSQNDIPKATKELETSFSSLIQDIATENNISIKDAKDLLHKSGFLQDDTSLRSLAKYDIIPLKYFAMLQFYISKLSKEILRFVEGQQSLNKSRGEQLILMGGFAEIPGLLEELKKNLQFAIIVFNIPNIIKKDEFEIINHTDSPLTAKFYNCIGTCLKNCYPKTVNLMPKETMALNTETTIMNSLKYAWIVPVIVIIAAAVFLGINFKTYHEDTAVIANQANIQAELTSLQGSIKQNTNIQTALDSIDKSMKPLIDYINGAMSPNLMIASVDTKNMLSPNKLTDSNGNTVSSSAISGTATPNANNLIIRGYANSQTDFTSFYDGLSKLTFVKSINMNGIQEVQLPSGEKILMFEIEVIK